MKRKVYQELAERIDAYHYYMKLKNEKGKDKQEERIEEIVKKYLPHGSGIDGDIWIDIENSSGNKVIIKSAFHKLDQGGFYDGWINFRVIVIPDFISDFKLKIIGNFGERQDIKDYLYDLFYFELGKEI